MAITNEKEARTALKTIVVCLRRLNDCDEKRTALPLAEQLLGSLPAEQLENQPRQQRVDSTAGFSRTAETEGSTVVTPTGTTTEVKDGEE